MYYSLRRLSFSFCGLARRLKARGYEEKVGRNAERSKDNLRV